MISGALDELRATDDVVSTLDFEVIVSELLQADLITAPVGELYSVYELQGVLVLFGRLDQLVDRALADISKLENLTPMVPDDMVLAFAIGQTYTKHILALTNITTIMLDAARRRADNRPTLVQLQNNSLKQMVAA